MLSLLEYIIESAGPSDDAIWYDLGKNKINFIKETQKPRYERLVQRYGLSGKNYRANVIKYMKETTYPLADPKDECIPRSQWRLKELVGTGPEVLWHRHTKKLTSYIFDTFKPKHKVITIFQCANAKPYEQQHLYTAYFKRYDFCSDMVWSSVPGIVPTGYTNLYPCRYTEWDHKVETEEDYNNSQKKKKEVALRFFKKFKYDTIVVVMQDDKMARYLHEIQDDNLEGLGSKIHFIIDDEYINRMADKYFKGNSGLTKTRVVGLVETQQRYEKLLRQELTGDDLSEFETHVKEYREERKEYREKKKNK